MKKLFSVFVVWLCISPALWGQAPAGRTLYIIDSIPLLRRPAGSDGILPEDIADTRVVKNKDSIRLLGWGKADVLTYMFTKEYRRRPDSLKRLPTRKQMRLYYGFWYLNGVPYTGRYIDYYNNGRIQYEGSMADGEHHGELSTYFRNGQRKSVIPYKRGRIHGFLREYYKNGALMHEQKYTEGKREKGGIIYFINGQVEQEVKGKNRTRYDTVVTYYSTGKVSSMKLVRDGVPVPDKKEENLRYYHKMFFAALNAGELKNANNHFYKIWTLDSAATDTYFKEGLLLLKEGRFDPAIVAFDKALHVEPLMREALAFRALARLRKHKYAGVSPEEVKADPLSINDLLSLPATEQEKICTDMRLADALDATELYVARIVSGSILGYCLK